MNGSRESVLFEFSGPEGFFESLEVSFDTSSGVAGHGLKYLTFGIHEHHSWVALQAIFLGDFLVCGGLLFRKLLFSGEVEDDNDKVFFNRLFKGAFGKNLVVQLDAWRAPV